MQDEDYEEVLETTRGTMQDANGSSQEGETQAQERYERVAQEAKGKCSKQSVPRQGAVS